MDHTGVIDSQTGLPADGLALFVKRDCPTCALIEPLVSELTAAPWPLCVFSQDDPSFPACGPAALDDRNLRASFLAAIDIVPTLVRYAGGREVGRAVGWARGEWRALSGIAGLAGDLPEFRPGCGSRTHEPGVYEHLQARHGVSSLASRRIAIGDYDDDVETCYARGWSDGLPVVPPTEVRVMRMLAGTRRSPAEIIGRIPPNLASCTVEKVAINAVMAGCRPEYLPVVLAAVEAALTPVFTLHGVLATTYFSAPVVIVNGPIAQRIGMNSGINALGQGNRANSTICRALNLVVRNVGGGRPGEVDRATLGAPSKVGLCFAEDESDPSWQPLSGLRGFAPGVSTVTLAQAHGPEAFVDQKSRTAEELACSFGLSLRNIGHPKLAQSARALVVLAPEHFAIFKASGWDRARIARAMVEATVRPGSELVAGAGGVAEGVPASRAGEAIPKFFEGGLELVRAGGPAGLFSAILPGWLAGRNRDELQFVTRAVGD